MENQNPFRAILSLPGVTSSSDLNSQLFFRGGNFDETLISLDGVPLYNPYHLGGIFSSVNNDIIKKETVHLSNYPLSQGGYLSGTLDMESLSGDLTAPKFSAAVSLLSSKGLLQIPIGKGSLLLAVRRTYFDILGEIIQAKFPYYFYDTYTKYSIPFDAKNLFSFSALYTKDVFRLAFEDKYIFNEVKEHPNWGNILLNAEWLHLINSESDIKFKTYFSSAYFDADMNVKELPAAKTIINNNIYDLT